MICYHHTDLDGLSAAYCVHSQAPKVNEGPHSYFACGYDDKFDKHTANDDVVIVDISISEKTYQMLLNTCKTARTVTWIDHHATSVDIIKNHKQELQDIDNLTYFVSTSACGAVLTYAYFKFPSNELFEIRKIEKGENYDINATIDKNVVTVTARKGMTWYEHKIEIPVWLMYVDDHDCWKKLYKESDLFKLGIETEDISIVVYDKDADRKIFNPFWESGQIINTEKYINIGANVNKYLTALYNRELADTFEWEYEGTTFLCKNATGNSYNFADKINKYPAAILFNYSGKSGLWEYSVYASERSNFNCKKFCEKFGGGGHLKASGFSTKMCIFTHNPKINKVSKNKEARNIFLYNVSDEIATHLTDTWKKIHANIRYGKGNFKTDEFLIHNAKKYNIIIPTDKWDGQIPENSIVVYMINTSKDSNTEYISTIADILKMSYNEKVFVGIYKSTFGAEDVHKEFLKLKDHINSFNGTLIDYNIDGALLDTESVLKDLIKAF